MAEMRRSISSNARVRERERERQRETETTRQTGTQAHSRRHTDTQYRQAWLRCAASSGRERERETQREIASERGGGRWGERAREDVKRAREGEWEGGYRQASQGPRCC
eukprot:1207130-Rhodomonas_salina.1